MAKLTKLRGFTIVEMMVVVVVVGILVSLATVAYTSTQAKSRQGKIDTDIRNLSEVIQVARARTGKPLSEITGSYWTGHYCLFQYSSPSTPIPDGTDFSQKTATTQACWNEYKAALDKISIASGDDVRNLLDPWNRPYYIDENDYTGTQCNYDALGWLSRPYRGGYNQNWPTDKNITSFNETCYPR